MSTGEVGKLSDRIRDYTYSTKIAPFLKNERDRVFVRAGDVHSAMGLQSRLPAVCAALGAKLMEDRFGLTLVKREGPHAGANVVFEFALKGDGPSPVTSRPTRPVMAPRRPASAAPSSPVLPPPAANELFLVSCVKTKLPHSASAKDLFCSDWFRSARAIVERRGADWLILSAKNGVVEPERVLEPYDVTLKNMPIEERRSWAERARLTIRALRPSARRIIMLAGAAYANPLSEVMRADGVQVQVPMSHLRQGEQLSWMKAQA